MNAETLHGVIQAARSGQIGGRSFQKIIYVGHSEGSLIGNELAQLCPKDVDTYVQTGFTPLLVIGTFGTIAAGGFLPALLVDPTMFAGYQDLTYLAASNQAKTTGFFYAGQFSQVVASRDYSMRGTVTTGEFVTALLGQLPAKGFTGSIMALTGERDQIFCSRLPTDPLIGYLGDCGEGDTSYTAMTKNLYPNAATFKYANVGDTGHDLNFHYTAQQTFKLAHDFLKSKGY